MRNVLLLVACLFLVAACEGANDYYGGNNDDHYNGYGNGYHGNNGYSDGYGYSNYYPYGNPYYSRSNIYWIDWYHPCHGYAYEGYCYRDKDDWRAAIYWDQQHGYDNNWHKKRKQWCEQHDCSRSHDTHDRDGYAGDNHRGTTDAQGRPLEPHVDKKGLQKVYPEPVYPEQAPRQHNSDRSPATESRPASQPYHRPSAPVTRSSGGTDNGGGGQVQRHPQHVEPVQQRQPQSSEVRQAPPQRSQNSAPEARSRSRGSQSRNTDTTSE